LYGPQPVKEDAGLKHAKEGSGVVNGEEAVVDGVEEEVDAAGDDAELNADSFKNLEVVEEDE